MPFSGNTFTLPSGATTAVPGQIVQSAVWNNIHSDIQTGMTQVMSQLTTGITGRNLLQDNGSFDVWQRGGPSPFTGGATISVAASTVAYTADRWYISTGANQAYTVSQQTGLVNPSFWSGKFQRNSGQTGITAVEVGFPLDTNETCYAHGAICTLSFLVKGGANWSPTNGTLQYLVACGTGTPVKQVTGYTGQTFVINGAVNVTAGGSNTAVVVNSTTIPTNTLQMEVSFIWTPTGTAGTDDSITIDDVQLEVDWSPTTWTPTTYDRAPFAWCLAACKRHYQKTFNIGVAPAQGATVLNALTVVTAAATKSGAMWQLNGAVRANPVNSTTTYNPSGASANWQDITAGASLAATIDTNTSNTNQIFIIAATAAAANDQLCIHVTTSAGI